MSLRNTDVRTPGLAAIAKKWKLPVAHIAKLVEIGAKTEFEHNKNLSKARQVARDHIAERPDYYQKLKRMEKSPISMKEENSVSAVRGLGFVSGDPAVDPVSQYIDTNAMAYEDQNGNILKFIKKNGSLQSLGFSSYDPTSDHGDVKERILGKKTIKEFSEFVRENTTAHGTGGEHSPPGEGDKYLDTNSKNIERDASIRERHADQHHHSLHADNGFNVFQHTNVKGHANRVLKELAGPEGGDAYSDYAGSAPLNVAKQIEAEPKKAYNKLKKESLGQYAREAINEIKAATVGRAIAKAAIQRKELTSGKMGKEDTKKWWKKQRLIDKGTEKLTGKTKVPATLDEYANTPTNEYTKPYNTKSLVRSTRTSHEHIRKPDQVEEPPGGGKVSPNGK